MVRLRPPCRSAGAPHRRSVFSRNRVTAPTLVVTLGVCILAAGAFIVPSLVFGADRPGALASAAVELAASTESVLVTLPWGSGDGQVGLRKPTEGLTQGPEALAVAPDGRIAVLDSVNHRLMLLNAAAAVAGKVSIALREPRFLAVDNDKLYVLDSDADRQLAAFAWDGTLLGTVTLPELTDVVTGLFATCEGPCVEVAHESAFLVGDPAQTVATAGPGAAGLVAGQRAAAAADRGKPNPASLRELAGRPLDADLGRVARVTFKPEQGMNIRSREVDKPSLEAGPPLDLTPSLAPGRTIDHLVSVDGDGKGGFIVGARLAEPDVRSGVPRSLTLTRLASSMAGSSTAAAPSVATGPDDVLLLAESSFAYLGQPYVVAPDGRIYQPVGSGAGYSIVVHAFAEGDSATNGQEVQP